MKHSLKKSLHWAGAGVGAAGTVFIAIRLYNYSEQIDFQHFGTTSWVAILSMAFIYGAANFFLASAWWYILDSLCIKVSKAWSIKIYGVSQLAKYIPGNLMQIASRQAIGVAADLPGWILAKSIIWELVLLSLAGLLLSCIAIPLLLPTLSLLFSFLFFIVVLILLIVCINHSLGFSAVRAFIYQILFLIVSGLVFVSTLTVIMDNGTIGFESIILYSAAYVSAWLLGVVTPGAPAGLGIREVVLLLFLGFEIPEADLLMAVVLNRLITVSGDGLFFAWAAFMSWEK